MKYPLIYARALNELWMATPDTVSVILNIAEFGVKESARSEEKSQKSSTGLNVIDGLATHTVSGILGKRLSSMDVACGGYDVDTLRGVLQAVSDDSKVWGLFLQMDTPGGAVTGIPEASEMLSSMNKPVFTYTDTLCCSGGVYLAAGATQNYASASSTYGSIGVYSAILDRSRMMANAGIDVKVIRSGKHKGMGAYGTAVSEEHIALIQKQVDELGSEFRTHVKSHRPDAKADAMEGQSFSGREAVSAGLVDAIFPTPEKAISHILKIKSTLG